MLRIFAGFFLTGAGLALIVNGYKSYKTNITLNNDVTKEEKYETTLPA